MDNLTGVSTYVASTPEVGGTGSTEKKYVNDEAAARLVENVKALVGSSSGGGHVAQPTAPDDTSLIWVDTSTGGVLKYYDADSKAWAACPAVWG